VGADTAYINSKQYADNYELKIQADDQLLITVDSKNQALIAPFNNMTVLGSGSNSSSAYSSAGQANYATGATNFVVDKAGNIKVPIFGDMTVLGKTCREVATALQDRFVREQYIMDAKVSVRIQNMKVTFLGAVNTPGTRTVSSGGSERVTLLQGLGQAGQPAYAAKLHNVLVVREVDGKRVSYVVDLTDAKSVYESPAYYLQQNDVVYVEPSKGLLARQGSAYNYLTIFSTVFGMLLSAASIVIAVTK
jgi:polysaccharide biosynthesis/export protein